MYPAPVSKMYDTKVLLKIAYLLILSKSNHGRDLFHLSWLSFGFYYIVIVDYLMILMVVMVDFGFVD